MKTLYVCEKCKKVFDTYTECAEHEASHIKIDLQYPTYAQELEKYYEYSEESDFPTTIVLQSVQSKIDDHPRFAVYKFKHEVCEEVSREVIDTGNERIKKATEILNGAILIAEGDENAD